MLPFENFLTGTVQRLLYGVTLLYIFSPGFLVVERLQQLLPQLLSPHFL
jgi:hypothetical protein